MKILINMKHDYNMTIYLSIDVDFEISFGHLNVV